MHALLNIKSLDDLQSNPIVGSSFEGFVIEQILQFLPRNWASHFYRTNAGAEIDLVTFPSSPRIIAFEVKYSLKPSLGKSFWNAFTDLDCTHGFVIYPGSELYPISKKVTALPVTQLSKLTELLKV